MLPSEEHGPTVHIYAPPATETLKVWGTCYGCKRHSPIAMLCYEWYEPTSVCLRCGEQHGVARPFARGWRERNRARARKWLQRAGILIPRSVAS